MEEDRRPGPSQTPKLLGKWREVFKQQKDQSNNEINGDEIIETSKYDRILES